MLSVIYFLFIMILCVLSMTMTMFIMYLNSRATDVRGVAMPAWVCSPEYVNIYICAIFYRSHYIHRVRKKRRHSILGITLTNLGTVSCFFCVNHLDTSVY